MRKAVWILTCKLCAWNNLRVKFCAWNCVKQFTHKVLRVKLYEAVALCSSCRIEHFLNSRVIAVLANRAALYYTNLSKKLHSYIDTDTDKYKDNNLSCFIFIFKQFSTLCGLFRSSHDASVSMWGIQIKRIITKINCFVTAVGHFLFLWMF